MKILYVPEVLTQFNDTIKTSQDFFDIQYVLFSMHIDTKTLGESAVLAYFFTASLKNKYNNFLLSQY